MSEVGIMTPPAKKKNRTLSRSGRSRRRTVKAVDYSKEQQFSDDDIFEDNLNDNKPARPVSTPSSNPVSTRKGRPGRPRKNNIDSVSFSSFPEADNSVYGTYLPGQSTALYTEKGYDPTQLPIRQKYLFEPEFELDGSPKIELIVGRRPIVEKTHTKDEHSGNGERKDKDDSDSSSEEDESEEEEVEASPKVKRKRGRPRKNPSPEKEESTIEVTPATSKKHIEYEYLVKFKGKSFLHLKWKTASDLESMNKSAKTMYRRFLKKLKAGVDDTLEDPTFDNAYAIPQKIVDEKEHPMVVELSDKELIAWEKKREREIAEEKSDSEDEKEPVKASPDEVKKEDSKANMNNAGVEAEEKKSSDHFGTFIF